MPLSVDWPNKFITVPKSELTLIEGTRYKITVDYWWQLLREKNATEEGIVYDTMYNNTPPTSSTPRIIDLINGYTAQFEDGLYSVDIVNGNTNWREIEVKNQVSVGTNNTTGFIDPTFLEAGLFNGVVTIDVVNGHPGEYKTPDGGILGTQQTPSNNIDDAHAISLRTGLPTFLIIGDLDINAAVPDVSGHSFIGSGKDRTTLSIADDAVVTDCAYYDAHVTGTLDGNSRLSECVIDNLNYIKGYIEQCVLSPGTIVLAGTEEAHFLDCWSGQPGTGTPTIDLGGSGQALALRNYNGGIRLINKTGPEPVSIDLNSGQIKIDLTTVTNGEIVCRGVGKLTEATTGAVISSGTYGDLTIFNELMNNPAAAKEVWDSNISDHLVAGSFGKEVSHLGHMSHAVYVNTEADTNGDGTVHSPFNNITDAIDLAEADGILELVVLADIVIDRQVKNFVITGIGTPNVDTNGKNLDKAEIMHCTVTGDYSGRLTVQECNLVGTFTVNGFFENCAVSADLVLPSGGIAYIKDCSTLVTESTPPSIDVGGVTGGADLVVTGYDGGIRIINVNQPSDSAKLVMSVGKVILEPSCTDGAINVGGVTHLEDNSNGSTVVDETLDPHYLTNVYQAHYNRRRWDKAANTVTVYDEDGVTPLHVFDTNDDLSELTPQ